MGIIRRIRNRSSLSIPQGSQTQTALGDFMVESAYSTFEVDTVLFMVPADEPRGKAMTWSSGASRLLRCRLFWVVQQDRQSAPWPTLGANPLTSESDFKEIVPVQPSKSNVSRLIDILSENLEKVSISLPIKSPITGASWSLKWSAKKVLHDAEEIPHSVAVVVDSMKRDEGNR